MNKEIIKKLMIILAIIIVILIIVLFVLAKGTKKQEEQLVEEEVTEKEVTDEDRIEQYDFLVVSNCVAEYLSGINQNNSRYYGRDDNNDFVIVVEQEEINRNAYNLLSSEYIKKNKITLNNVYQYVPEVKEDYIFVPIDMKLKKGEYINQYKVYGYAVDLKYNFVSYLYVIVNLDIDNKTFSIEPINEKKYQEDNFENNDIEIEANDNNEYIYRQLSEEYRLKQYFQNYKMMLLSNPEVAYQFLNQEYKEKCFGNIENFEKYITENRDKLLSATLEGYDAKITEDYTEYIEKDVKGNYYIFNISDENPIEFNVMLDTYVMGFSQSKEDYNNGSEQDKVTWNTIRFISAINDKKYYYAYHLLAESFRNRNFTTQDEFEEYVKNNFFENNIIQEGDLAKESEYYTYYLTISNEENNTKAMTIVMQLQEENNFTMSFSFDE